MVPSPALLEASVSCPTHTTSPASPQAPGWHQGRGNSEGVARGVARLLSASFVFTLGWKDERKKDRGSSVAVSLCHLCGSSSFTDGQVPGTSHFGAGVPVASSPCSAPSWEGQGPQPHNPLPPPDLSRWVPCSCLPDMRKGKDVSSTVPTTAPWEGDRQLSCHLPWPRHCPWSEGLRGPACVGSCPGLHGHKGIIKDHTIPYERGHAFPQWVETSPLQQTSSTYKQLGAWRGPGDRWAAYTTTIPVSVPAPVPAPVLGGAPVSFQV